MENFDEPETVIEVDHPILSEPECRDDRPRSPAPDASPAVALDVASVRGVPGSPDRRPLVCSLTALSAALVDIWFGYMLFWVRGAE